MDPEALAAAFSAKPALHRYPGSMAARVQELAKLVVERYRGRTEAIWEGAPTGAELFRRVKELPGFGEQKAKIFVALLGKQLGVRPEGWETVSAPFSDPGTFRSVADITDTDTLRKVREFKQALKAANKAKGPHGQGGTGEPQFRATGDEDGSIGPEGGQQDGRNSDVDGQTKAICRTRREALSTPGTQGLADRHLYLCTADRPDLAAFLASCIAGGVDVVQLRDKHLEARALVERGRLAARVCADHSVPFILNDRPDLALEVEADGVHVGQDDAPPALARRILGPTAIVGPLHARARGAGGQPRRARRLRLGGPGDTDADQAGKTGNRHRLHRLRRGRGGTTGLRDRRRHP